MAAEGNDTTDQQKLCVPQHVAIIMDGNGRWATKRGLPRAMGHKHGVAAVREIVRAAGDLGIAYLTLFSFSTENWARPDSEINELFSLLRLFLRRDLAELHQNNVKLQIIGERNGLPDDLIEMLDDARKLTAKNNGQVLIVAFNYGSRNEIVKAARRLAEQVECGDLSPQDIDEKLISAHLDTQGIPDPDLMIRTSGEQRISNFLLWQLAYTELVFVDCEWPDFGPEELRGAIETYKNRDRRFGGIVMETGS